jgi:hypothetical protein
VSPRADLAAYDRNGQLALLVEAKSRLNTDAEWAAKMHRNLIAHGTVPGSNYFMLALPDNLYLWSSATKPQGGADPNYVFSPEPLLRRYLRSSGLALNSLSESSLAILLGSWINDMIRYGVSDDLPEPQRSLLLQSGLAEAIRGGRLEVDQQL